MITYSKVLWGLHLLPRVYGSALPRALPFSLLSAGLTALIFHWKEPLFTDIRTTQPYAFHVFVYVAAFAIIFRTNFGYNRYWEGRTLIQNMTSRWFAAAVHAMHFDSDFRPEDETKEQAASAALFKAELMHFFSLMHGLALQNLRNDWDLDNLKRHNLDFDMPPVDAHALAHVILRDRKGEPESNSVGRFSFLDIFMLRDTNSRRETYYRAMPLSVLHGLSPAESECLGSSSMQRSSHQYETVLTGFDRRTPDMACCMSWTPCCNLTTGRAADGAGRRVEVSYGWLLDLINLRVKNGGLATSAPALAAGVWMPLGDGFNAYDGCRKLSDTPFPFPWAQVILLTLVCLALTFPIIMALTLRDMWLAVVLDFLSINTLWVLNEVARDLEDPFVYEPNDLPLARLQYDFNEKLLAVANARRPPSLPDIQRCCSRNNLAGHTNGNCSGQHHAPPPDQIVIKVDKK